ncbi:hypothetical protein HDR61_00810 [bacterium]|nr:hypothetical protein [bacterium]
MEKIKDKISRVFAGIKTPRAKKRIYVLLVVLVALWVVYRFVAIGVMNGINVFNPARDVAENGAPVSVISVQRAPGVVREPLTVHGNRAYVSGPRAALLHAGMRIGDGEIVSVSSNIDLDTGMHVVHTRGVPDGLHMAEFRTTGYLIPIDAVNNGSVYIVRDGVSVRVPVTVSRQDTETAYVTSGLNDGDMVILSRVADGAKVNIKK